MSLSFWLMTTLGLGPGLSAAMLSRSSRLSVTLRFPWRSRDLPTLVALEADVGVSSELLKADRMLICVEMSLSPSEDLRRPTISLSSLMSSRRFVSSSSSILSEGCAPRADRSVKILSGRQRYFTNLGESFERFRGPISSCGQFRLVPVVFVRDDLASETQQR